VLFVIWNFPLKEKIKYIALKDVRENQ
jgi:hypothetical protein